MEQPSNRIRCIVKLGGAAITCKSDFETINEENLKTVSSHLRKAMISESACRKVIGMDWSKRPGMSETPISIDDISDQHVRDSQSFIVVHGAGSFGHFQASKSGVHKGGLSQPLVKAGFVATRISVTSLNLEIVRALAREGIPSIGVSPFTCGWSTCQRNVRRRPKDCIYLSNKLSPFYVCFSARYQCLPFHRHGNLALFLYLQIAEADMSMVVKAIDSGFVPVLHGDAVLDKSQECTILSGDVIIRHLAAELQPDFVLFLTDVFGVYDRPPTESDAVLLREIAVREDGSWSVVKPTLQETNKQVEITVAAHDTTGGMVTKISEAAMIAKLGIDVYIVKAATDHSLKALSGSLRDEIPEDWLGTVIRFVK